MQQPNNIQEYVVSQIIKYLEKRDVELLKLREHYEKSVCGNCANTKERLYKCTVCDKLVCSSCHGYNGRCNSCNKKNDYVVLDESLFGEFDLDEYYDRCDEMSGKFDYDAR